LDLPSQLRQLSGDILKALGPLVNRDTLATGNLGRGDTFDQIGERY
tara:strand:- start:854 stop:991 length:138 start_codon:yes stop_codon:yes gene_type:complete